VKLEGKRESSKKPTHYPFIYLFSPINQEEMENEVYLFLFFQAKKKRNI
jgi:hypothetical protein